MQNNSAKMTDKEMKKFSFTLFILPIIPAIIVFRHGHIKTAVILILIFWAFCLFTLLSKAFTQFSYSKIKILLKFFGDTLAKIALFIVYILCLIPTGLLMKIIGRDRLRIKKQSLNTYWKDVQEQDSSYEYQF